LKFHTALSFVWDKTVW